MAEKKTSKTRNLAEKTVFAALQVLKDNGGEMPGREVLNEVERRVDLDEWAKDRFDKTGYIRWQSVLHFYTIDCVKAGYLKKKKGIWYLTSEGEEALQLGESGLIDSAVKAYREWKKQKKVEIDHEDGEADSQDEEDAVALEQIEQLALDSLEKHVRSMNPYEFQDLCAALLRGMGYYTPVVAPRGKDGGVDIVAYRDPLGTVAPRIRVQVKHRQDAASVKEVRELMGLLQKDGDVGIFISSGGYTSDAKLAARDSSVHVELIDMLRFINLWQDFYHKLQDEDKQLLPLIPINILAPSE